jgi:hypothetical protein
MMQKWLVDCGSNLTVAKVTKRKELKPDFFTGALLRRGLRLAEKL